MGSLLQWWAGLFYLLNKVFFSFHERATRMEKTATSRRWEIAAWTIYLLGVPAWVIILGSKHAWIAAALEAGGIPAMVLGLLSAIYGTQRKSLPWLDWVARLCIVFGFSYSLYDFGGLRSFSQWLEIGLVLGFLVGTYLLAKKHRSGYLWYVLMHVSCAWLMWVQGNKELFFGQIISLGFIVDAYLVAKKKGP